MSVTQDQGPSDVGHDDLSLFPHSHPEMANKMFMDVPIPDPTNEFDHRVELLNVEGAATNTKTSYILQKNGNIISKATMATHFKEVSMDTILEERISRCRKTPSMVKVKRQGL